MNGDTREWWIVQSGSLKFTVEGREPVVATKGFMVQVPYRTLYQIENVGDEPALRFEVNVARARKLYPLDETPAPLPGFDYVPTRVTRRPRHARRRQPARARLQQGRRGRGARGRVRHRRPQLREHHHRQLSGAAARQQGPLPRGRLRVLADHARQDPLQDRRAAGVRGRARRRGLRAAPDVAPRELRRQHRACARAGSR